MEYFLFASLIGMQFVAATFWQVSRPDGCLLQNSLFEALKVVGEPHISNNEAARLHPSKPWEVAILGLGWGWTWTRAVVVFFGGKHMQATKSFAYIHVCSRFLEPSWAPASWKNPELYIYINIYTKQMDHSRNMVMRGATRMSLSAHMRAVISKHNNYSLQAIRLIVGMHTQQPDISNSRVMLVHIIMKFLHIFPWLYTPLLGARHCHPSATSHISYCKRPRRHHSSILAFQTASSWAPNNKLVEYHSISPPSLPGKCPNIHWWSLSIDQLSIDDS